MRKLPPLNSLKAFEVSARHKSFTKAASELAVTQGAVSKQVKILEDYLGLKLFERKYQHIILTENAEHYLSSIQDALKIIEDATDQFTIFPRNEEILHLNILPSLSNRWLIPMLNDFKKNHLKITINIQAGDGLVDFEASEIDIAIRAGKSKVWKGVYAEKIMGEDLVPVYAPKLGSVKLENIQKYNLLQHTTRPEMWNEYLAAMGFNSNKIEHKLAFEHFFMLIDAAIGGQGVALIPRFLIENELLNGSLLSVLDDSYNSPYSYYFICKKDALLLDKNRAFKSWLFSKVSCK